MNIEDLNKRFKNNAFFSKIKGVTMVSERQENIKALKPGQKLFYVFENNPKDPNAIRLYADEAHNLDLGYISKELAPYLRDFKKHNVDFDVRVAQITGGDGKKPTCGCNILIVLKR